MHQWLRQKIFGFRERPLVSKKLWAADGNNLPDAQEHWIELWSSAMSELNANVERILPGGKIGVGGKDLDLDIGKPRV